jgi:hypothetical protein
METPYFMGFFVVGAVGLKLRSLPSTRSLFAGGSVASADHRQRTPPDSQVRSKCQPQEISLFLLAAGVKGLLIFGYRRFARRNRFGNALFRGHAGIMLQTRSHDATQT